MLPAKQKKKSTGLAGSICCYSIHQPIGGIAVMGVTTMFVGTMPSQQRKNAIGNKNQDNELRRIMEYE